MNKLRLLPLSTVLLSSCLSSTPTSSSIEVKGDLSVVDGVKLDYDNAFFDGFSSGVDSNNWYIGNHSWGTGNGGVIPDNVHYTDDGVLFLSGTGKYYADGDIEGVGDVKDGRYAGAALISKFLVRPGRYELKMKPLPRQGACTAFWTYAHQKDATEDKNHEIDIELPGGNRSGLTTFENILNTNYTTEQKYISQDTSVSDVLGNETYLNDGKFHTFGFDWYTDPEMIVYSVDGKVCAISDSFVPTLEARLWLGVWFPVTSSFVGSPDFEKDIMEVDYVKYVPFLEQPYDSYTPTLGAVAELDEYPSQPESKPVAEFISNGNFENLGEGKDNKGWNFSKYIDEEQDTDAVSNILSTGGKDGSVGAFIKDGGILEQSIDSVYSSFEYDFSFDALGFGRANITYYGASTLDVTGKTTVEASSTFYKNVSSHLVAPEGTKSMNIRFDTDNGKELKMDNISLIRRSSDE